MYVRKWRNDTRKQLELSQDSTKGTVDSCLAQTKQSLPTLA